MLAENPASISILPTTIFGPLFSFSGGRVHNIGLKYVSDFVKFNLNIDYVHTFRVGNVIFRLFQNNLTL